MPTHRFVCLRRSPSALLSRFILLVGLLMVSGCGGSSGESALGWLMGAESQFDAGIKGAVTDSLHGTADFRTDDRGRLVGIELNRDGAPMQGLSLELEPRPPETDQYTVVDPVLMNAPREGEQPGFVAYLESDAGSFEADEGHLHITAMGDHHIEGTFELYMHGERRSGPSVEVDITVKGAFQATRPAQ